VSAPTFSACPKCKTGDQVSVRMTMWAYVTREGIEQFEQPTWFPDSEAICEAEYEDSACGWTGTAGELIQSLDNVNRALVAAYAQRLIQP
jgi:hypothetical protein